MRLAYASNKWLTLLHFKIYQIFCLSFYWEAIWIKSTLTWHTPRNKRRILALYETFKLFIYGWKVSKLCTCTFVSKWAIVKGVIFWKIHDFGQKKFWKKIRSNLIRVVKPCSFQIAVYEVLFLFSRV